MSKLEKQRKTLKKQLLLKLSDQKRQQKYRLQCNQKLKALCERNPEFLQLCVRESAAGADQELKMNKRNC